MRRGILCFLDAVSDWSRNERGTIARSRQSFAAVAEARSSLGLVMTVALLPAWPAGSVTVEKYIYDARGRLSIACQAPPYAGYRRTYAHDKADNRQSAVAQNFVLTITAGTGVHSPDGRFYLTMQTDQNFVLYGPSGALWATATNGTGASFAAFQGDGNFVLYTSGGVPVWSSGTNSHCANLAIQNDGNVVIYSPQGAPVWATNTGGH
jgi:hypothetical protein